MLECLKFLEVKVDLSSLNAITDQSLLSLTQEKAQRERNLTLEIIELLQEVYRRRLHLKRGYASLHQYCVQELKYSDGAAQRRIKAMRFVEELPEVKNSIESGALNLCTVSQLQSAFEAKASAKKPIPKEMKLALVSQVENVSRREAEKVIIEICPKVVKYDEKITRLNSQEVKLELVINLELLEKLEKLKRLTSHKNKNLIELLGELVDDALSKRDPEVKGAQRQKGAPPVAAGRVTSHPSRYIPATTRQEVWMRDKGCCTYFDPVTKRKCDSNHRLQFEHIEPYSFGGKSTVDNLRLLCANHNGLTAQQIGGWRQ